LAFVVAADVQDEHAQHDDSEEDLAGSAGDLFDLVIASAGGVAEQGEPDCPGQPARGVEGVDWWDRTGW
jgi:hypothetical protein